MDINTITGFIFNNWEIIGTAIAFLATSGLGVHQNFNVVKVNAVKYAEGYVNRGLNNDELAKEKMNQAVNYFYDKFLTRLIPGWILFIFLPKQAVINLLEAEYQEMKLVGMAKLKEKLLKQIK